MPNIRQYEAPVQGFRPSETGAEAWNRAGMRIEENYQRAGQAIGQGLREDGQAVSQVGQQVEQAQTYQQVSKGSAQASAMLADGAADWNSVLKDPNFDPNDAAAARQAFQDRMQARYDQFSKGFSTPRGQEWAAEHVSNLQNHFSEKTIADVSTAAGAATLKNINQTTDNLASAIHNDPTTLDAALATFKSSAETMVQHSGMSGEDAATHGPAIVQDGQRRLVQMGIKSTMDRNVAAGQDMLSGKYADFLKPEDIQELGNYAKTVTRANHSDSMIDRSNQEFAERQASEAKANNFFKELAPIGPDGRPGPVTLPADINARILQSGMKPSEIMSVFGFVDKIQKDKMAETIPRNDSSTASDLMGRLGSSDNPTTNDQITDAVKAGKLTPQFGMELMGKASAENKDAMASVANNPLVKNEFDKALQRITSVVGGSVGMNTAGKAQSDQFRIDTLHTLQDAVMKHQDIRPFLDPTSDQYLFSNESIDRYKPTDAQRTAGLVASNPRNFIGQITAAFRGQEGPGTSDKGAVAGLMPGTFKQYAQPGENFDNPADRQAVNDRVIADLTRRWPNDPARVAVGYFSGPGNVSPPGSAHPWIDDKNDGHKLTSSYVADIATRMNKPLEPSQRRPLMDILSSVFK